MKIIHLPHHVRGMIFDLDNTLYHDPGYASWQEDSQLIRLAAWMGTTVPQARASLARARIARSQAGLPKTSMANYFLEFGVDMATIIRWREEAIHPCNWLRPNPALQKAFATFAPQYSLALLTNNPRSIGLASLRAIGIASYFSVIVGLDDTGYSKPRPEPFVEVCARLAIAPSQCISIGDRNDIDIEPALALGLGGILVDGPDDVPRLFFILNEKNLAADTHRY